MAHKNHIHRLFITLYFLTQFFTTGYTQYLNQPNVRISGEIYTHQPPGESFRITGPMDLIYVAVPEKVGPSTYRFELELSVIEFQYCVLAFQEGRNKKELELYLEPGNDIHIRAQLDNFYPSVEFSGRGYEASKFLYDYHQVFHGYRINKNCTLDGNALSNSQFAKLMRSRKANENDFLNKYKGNLSEKFRKRQLANIYYGIQNCLNNYAKKFPGQLGVVLSFGEGVNIMPEDAQFTPNYNYYLWERYQFFFKHLGMKDASPKDRYEYITKSYLEYDQLFLQQKLIYNVLRKEDFYAGEELFHQYADKLRAGGVMLDPKMKSVSDALMIQLEHFYHRARAWQEGHPINQLYLWDEEGHMKSWYDPAHPEHHFDEEKQNRGYQLLFFRHENSFLFDNHRILELGNYLTKLGRLAESYASLDMTYISIDGRSERMKHHGIPIDPDYGMRLEEYPVPYYRTLMHQAHFDVLLVSPEGEIIAKNPESEDLEEMLDLGISDRFPSLFSSFSGILTILFFLSLGAIVAVLIYRIRLYFIRRKEEQRRRWTELELKAIRSQLNPHFLFNTMSSIQSLISSENPEIASEHLAGLADLMRMVLKHSEKGIISLAEELEAAEKYCQLEALRFNFSYEIDIAPEIDPFLIEVPAMIIQPYIENAILHGISNCNGACWIRIEVNQLNQSLLIVVEDNGIGVMQAEMQESSGNGMGMKLNSERLALLHHKAGSVQVFDKSELEQGERGTRIEIWLPIEELN